MKGDSHKKKLREKAKYERRLSKKRRKPIASVHMVANNTAS